MSENNRIAVVTVHGTGDTATSPAGEKWFQQGSVFTEQVKARLAVRGFAADIIPLLWSGANSARAREAGADELFDCVKRLEGQYKGQVHIIAHSHGGNVANEAASWLRWGRRPGKERIASLTTVGTPFFKQHTGPAERFAGLAFLALSVLSSIFFAFAVLALTVVAVEEGVAALEIPLSALLIIGGLVSVALFFMLRLSLQGYRRITRPRRSADTDQAVHAIWHRNDEAIAFLQKVEALPIRPFPRGAWVRQSRNGGIVWGVRAVLLLGLLGALMFVPGVSAAPIMRDIVGAFGDETAPGDPIVAGFLLLVLTPLAFVVVYLAYRLVFGVFTDAVFRPGANRAVEGALKGMAFGRDGDETLSEVATSSHILPTHEVVLEGPLAERLQQNAAGAAAALIEKYRWSLFTVGSDTNAALTDLASDAMTWDSLIHTTYFDHQETAEMIADHIAVRAAQKL